jgi:cysteine-rich repeat protein
VKRFPLAQPATVVLALALLADGMRARTAESQVVEVPKFAVAAVDAVCTSEVAVETGGTMLFVWQCPGANGIETYARQYSAGGVALGPVTRVNPQSEFSFGFASDLRGGYVATWMHRSSTMTFDLFGLALDASGAMLGSDFKVNQFSTRPFGGVVAGLPSGSVVVWTSSRTLVVTDVLARLYTPNGFPRGDQFRVGSGQSSTHLVAGRSDGGFQVAWQETDGYRPVFRVYDAAGNPRMMQTTFDDVSQPRSTRANPFDDTGVLAGGESNYVWAARVSGTGATYDRSRFEPVNQLQDADVEYVNDGSVVLAWVDVDGDVRRARGRVYDGDLDPLVDAFDFDTSEVVRNVALARRTDGASVVATWTTEDTVWGSVVRTCTPLNHYCGNGTIDAACGETCDDGAGNDDGAPNACRTDCHVAHCGDGVVDTGEECDDGNQHNCDGCSALCTAEVGLGCGDGIPYPTCGESCDDANSVAGDGCDAHCVAERALGGGSAGTDCLAEWSISNTANVPRVDDRGFIVNKQLCVDDDPRCDFDGGVPGSCTFHVAVCVNNTNVGACHALSRLAEWRLVRPSAKQAAHDPIYAADRAAFADVPSLVVGPETRNLCTGFASVIVPIRGKQGKLKLKSVARGYSIDTDTDTLALTCLTSAL